MPWHARTPVVIAVVLAVPMLLRGQGITRENYHDYLPPKPRITTQTAASAALHLYGDRSGSEYRDSLPLDGVDDRRGRHLLRIAERFSPLVRRNNFSVPRSFDAVLGPAQLLHVDRWQAGRRLAVDSVWLGDPQPVRIDGVGGAESSIPGDPDLEGNDLAILKLLREESPFASRPNNVRPSGEVESVLYFDLPGNDRATWREANSDARMGSQSRIYAHAFLVEHDSSGSAPRFHLVMQYWFFYPFNDAANSHEGDWEHINVIITTTRRRAAARSHTVRQTALDSTEVAAILDAEFPVEDSLVIGAVDYYFHHSTTRFDYIALADSSPRGEADARYAWEDVGFVKKIVRERMAVAGGRLATHPLVFVGGDNRGPDELLVLRPRFGGAFKRNSGASYPLPGTWQTVAVLGVTERVSGRATPDVRDDSTLGWYDVIDDEHFKAYRAQDITLIPDWERVYPLLENDATSRRRWAWLVLPLHWGFPAMHSPGAGLIKHVNFGNISPMGPAFNSGWNTIGESSNYSTYDLRVLRTPVSPTTPWAVLRSGWGVLNAPLAAWGLMPGYNVAVIQVMPWVGGGMHILGAPPARTYSPNRLPRRFTTEGQGIFTELGGRDFASILRYRDESQAAAGDPERARPNRRARPGVRFWFNLYFSERFSVENTYSGATSDLSLYVAGTAADGLLLRTASLEMRQLTGGVRYDLIPVAREPAQLYTRVGYGWLWYHADAFRTGGGDLEDRIDHGGYLPPLLPHRRWWPNTWYGGVGVEYFSPRSQWLFGRMGYGTRVEYTELVNRLHLGEGSGTRSVWRGDLAWALIFGW